MFIRTKDGYFEYLPPFCFADGDDNAGGGEAAEPNASAAPVEGDGGDQETEPAQRQTPWFQKRINELTAEKHQERREREAVVAEVTVLRAQLEAMQNDGQRPSTGDPASVPRDAGRKPLTDAEIDRMVQEKAAALAHQMQLNEACNRTAKAGQKAYDDFTEARDNLISVFGEKITPAFLEAVTDLPNSHEVFYKIAKNPDLAGEILDLPPARMGVRIARLAAEDAPTPAKPASRVSSAPPPIRMVDGSARAVEPDVYDTKQSVGEWMKRRDREVAERYKQKYA